MPRCTGRVQLNPRPVHSCDHWPASGVEMGTPSREVFWRSGVADPRHRMAAVTHDGFKDHRPQGSPIRLSTDVPASFYNHEMLDSLLSPAIVPDLSAAILAAPGWCRVGITAPSEDLRLRSARELALAIVESLSPAPDDAGNQLPLAL